MQPNPARMQAAGFTLLELMVVLAIVAGLAAITTPGFSRVYARVRFSYEREDVERQLLVLPAQVRREGHSGILTAPDPAPDAKAVLPVSSGPNPETWQMLRLDLPEGWTMQVSKPIIYRFNGICEGGQVVFSLPPLSLTYDLVAPLCRPNVAHAAPS